MEGLSIIWFALDRNKGTFDCCTLGAGMIPFIRFSSYQVWEHDQ